MAQAADDVLKRLFEPTISTNPGWLVPATVARTRDATMMTPKELFAPYVFEMPIILMGSNLVVAFAVLLARPGNPTCDANHYCCHPCSGKRKLNIG